MSYNLSLCSNSLGSKYSNCPKRLFILWAVILGGSSGEICTLENTVLSSKHIRIKELKIKTDFEANGKNFRRASYLQIIEFSQKQSNNYLWGVVSSNVFFYVWTFSTEISYWNLFALPYLHVVLALSNFGWSNCIFPILDLDYPKEN
jgi:hypothetical protein